MGRIALHGLGMHRGPQACSFRAARYFAAARLLQVQGRVIGRLLEKAAPLQERAKNARQVTQNLPQRFGILDVKSDLFPPPPGNTDSHPSSCISGSIGEILVASTWRRGIPNFLLTVCRYPSATTHSTFMLYRTPYEVLQPEKRALDPSSSSGIRVALIAHL